MKISETEIDNSYNSVLEALELDDTDAAATLLAKMRNELLREVGYRLGFGTGYGMTKRLYLTRLAPHLPKLTATSRAASALIAEQVRIADEREKLVNTRELCAGRLYDGRYDPSAYDSESVEKYDRLIAEFDATHR